MRKTILVIDDECKIRSIYKRLFTASASSLFDILEAGTAEEATECLLRHSVDLVILDIKFMPVGGKYMFSVIREFDPEQKILVASVFPEEAQKLIIPDADDYFDKSQGPLALLSKMTNLLTEYYVQTQ